VDKNLTQARKLAETYNIPLVEDDFKNIYGKVDAAIVALPHHLHGNVGLELLQNNIHVLVEKPMALKKSECDRMIKASHNFDVILSVGLIRRFYSASGFVKNLIDNNMLGRITSFDIREGNIFSWNSSSDFMFRKFAGGGVLVDIGVHAMDTLLWWLGDYEDVLYYDDAMGGVEANSELHLIMRSGARGTLELSRTRNLRNTYIINGEYGTLEVGLGVNPEIKLFIGSKEMYLSGQIINNKRYKNNKDVFIRQLKDFAEAIKNKMSPYITGVEGRRSVELMEACYSYKRKLKEPWMASIEETI
ncbi:MAG: Gfo/Idh/MocA family oxidoreductase, partial [Balneolales bacterium]